nr:SIS domain-containing protein [Streptomyces acidicola]
MAGVFESRTAACVGELAICNTNGSTIPRESDAVLYTHAGPEVAVASAKAFLTQLVACYLVALYLGQAHEQTASPRACRAGQRLADLGQL